MGDERRTAERNAGAFLGPDLGGGGGMIAVPVNSMSAGTGPGEPGPEDEWKIPGRPEDEVEPVGVATPEPAHAGHGSGLLHRLTHRG
ncbi:MAG: hypothetical protein ABSC46_05110 [Candidatus Limnocylindrales bacterium]|jgi:hypothetical protein